MFKRMTTTSLVLFVLGGLSYSQTAGKTLTFDAASVKLTPMTPRDGRGRIMGGPSGGPGTGDPGRIHYADMSLKNLLMKAYDVRGFQIQGPSWLDTERVDVNATMPPETTKEQFRVMLRNLLVERFRITLHRETKASPIYSLMVAKGGPRMKESSPVSPTKDNAGAAPSFPVPAQPIGPDGRPVRPGLTLMLISGHAYWIGKQETMVDLADRLTTEVGHPVTDATGLKGRYDFTMTYLREGMNPPNGLPPPSEVGRGALPDGLSEVDTSPDVFRAVKEQLGLMLKAGKGPLDMIVIDHIEKTPIEN